MLHDWVTRQAQRRAEAAAVVLEGQALTYGVLDTLSNRLARTLIDAGCPRGMRVCLLMPKTPMAIVGILGIYKAGCIYVPLDAASPVARLAKIIESCDTRWVLAGGSGLARLDGLLRQERLRNGLSIGWMDSPPAEALPRDVAFSLDDLLEASGAPVPRQGRAGDAAHILFTSGSTGVPKGVVITHANVIAFVEWAVKHFGITASDRLSCHSPLHFDLSMFDIFGAFAAGAELHLVPAEASLLPNTLAEWIRASALTQWFSVPSALHYMAKFDVVRPADFPALKRVLWCGDVLPTASLSYWMRQLPHARFTNLYGPTEATIASSFYDVPAAPRDDRAAIPIGTACEGEELLVLDDRRQPVPRGTIGDLYIRGIGLSPGYWRDPEKTAEAFLQNPASDDPSDRIYRTGDLARIGEDGQAYFLGRTDSQIKSRGYRIELGEIESALNTIKALGECAVVAVASDGFEHNVVGCAYVPAPGRKVTPARLRLALEKVLPSYMIPSRWMEFSELPKNANGKVDRGHLKQALAQHATRPARYA